MVDKSPPRPVTVGELVVSPGERRHGSVPVARLPTQTMLELPLAVVHGRRRGPSLWLSAALHGDEVNGVEIIHRLLAELDPLQMAGTVYAVPIVNVFGFVQQSRYLPDRRDLNRSFPGSASGSMAARLAHLFMTEIVARCDYGVDLHTAAQQRTNHPQVRANLDDRVAARLARAFAAPFLVHSPYRDGSLRKAAAAEGVPVVVYEGGEALRFNPQAIEIGIAGIRRILSALKMLPMTEPAPEDRSIIIKNTRWVRARRSGIYRNVVELGSAVTRRQEVGVIGDPFGETAIQVNAATDGWVLGRTTCPLVNQGDALVHIGRR